MSLKSLVIKKVIKSYLRSNWGRKKRESNALLWTAAGVGAVLATRALTKKVFEYDFRGKTVLITGGSRGLGLVMAREFLREGARVAICARDEDELERAYDDLMKYSANVFTVVCDVTSQFQIAEMVQSVRHRFGQIDVLVNNAGTISVGPVEEMTLEDYEKAMDTNFWAALHSILAVFPEMRARHEGRIVNIASIGGKISVPHLLPYSASKFALVGLSSGLNAELKKDGVIVTTVCPGLMRTGSPRNANFKGQNHSKGNEELKTLAASKSISLPTALGAKEKKMLDDMSKLSGEKFDREYMDDMVDAHDKNVALFEKEASKGKDAETKAWAEQKLPTLREHQKMAHEIATKLGVKVSPIKPMK